MRAEALVVLADANACVCACVRVCVQVCEWVGGGRKKKKERERDSILDNQDKRHNCSSKATDSGTKISRIQRS